MQRGWKTGNDTECRSAVAHRLYDAKGEGLEKRVRLVIFFISFGDIRTSGLQL